jgi:cytochrome c-type protein NapC
VFGKTWSSLRQRCRTCAKVTLVAGTALIALVVGGTLIAGGAAGLAWTNQEQFCIRCHEMRDNVYAEYKGSIHDTNRSGVRAICSDCHVPREPVAMLKRKVRASFELYGHFVTGVIDTPEKFQAHRYEMAKRVWTRMKETDSLECRNCHHADAMSSELQSEKAKARHAKGKADGKTCIDCHFGIAHREPEGGPGPQELIVERKTH